MQKYYKTIALLIVFIALLAVAVIKFTPHASAVAVPVACTQEAMICPDGSSVGRTGPDCSFVPCPGVSTSTSPFAVTPLPIQNPMLTVTGADMNQTVDLTLNQKFVLNLGTLRWTVTFTPDNIERVANTSDGTGQGIYQAIGKGTTILHGTGAPICGPGQACPDFLEVMTITFVVE